MVPDFIVIGAQKSASTFLQMAISDHPEIYMPKGEIPYFEDPDYGELGNGYLPELFAGRTERRLGFKRPNYLGKREVPARIRTDLPGVRLVAVLRDPLERLISAYYHYMRGHFLPVMPLNEGLARLFDDAQYRRDNPRSHELLEFGLYSAALERYKHFLDRDQLLVLFHEDVVRAPVDTVRAVYSYLEVDSSFVPSTLGQRPQAVPYNPVRLRLSRIEHRLMTTMNEERTRVTRRPMTWRVKASAGAVRLLDKAAARVVSSDKPVLDRELERKIIDYYASDVSALEAMTHRDLSNWLRPRSA